MTRILAMIFMVLILIAAGGRMATAAPQILAALPAGSPQQLVCKAGVCEIEFSAICLQSSRPLPDRGTLYQVRSADLGALKLWGRTADGATVPLPADLVRVESRRGQTAVALSVPRRELDRRNLASVTLGLDRLVALLPVATDSDTTPQSAADVTQAIAGLRLVGGAWTEINIANMTIARLTQRLRNRLPANNVTAAEALDRQWHRVLAEEASIPPATRASALNLVSLCQRRSGHTPLRRCLGDFHDQVMRSLNGKYWTALAAGS